MQVRVKPPEQVTETVDMPAEVKLRTVLPLWSLIRMSLLSTGGNCHVPGSRSIWSITGLPIFRSMSRVTRLCARLIWPMPWC